MIRKLASMLVIALFVISFAGAAVSQEAQETMTLKGIRLGYRMNPAT